MSSLNSDPSERANHPSSNPGASRSQPIATRGVHHLGLTVPDLARARGFFTDTFQFEVVGEISEYPAVFLSDGDVMLTLWQARDARTATPFDRSNNIGLHHFALRVDDAEALESAHQRLLTEPDVEIEFAPQDLGNGPTRHLMCRIPGGIRLEILAPGASQ